MLSRFFLIIICNLFLAFAGTAQINQEKGEFHGFFRGGLVASQIHADDIGGYNKLGGTAGVGVYTPVANNVLFQLELNYAMRGSRKPARPDKGDPDSWAIEPHYLDIPILFQSQIRKFGIEYGLCNGILLFDNIRTNGAPPPPEYTVFNRYELALNLGLEIPAGDYWFGNVRFHYSITPAAGQLQFVNGWNLLGGAYNNAVSFTLGRRLIPQR